MTVYMSNGRESDAARVGSPGHSSTKTNLNMGFHKKFVMLSLKKQQQLL